MDDLDKVFLLLIFLIDAIDTDDLMVPKYLTILLVLLVNFLLFVNSIPYTYNLAFSTMCAHYVNKITSQGVLLPRVGSSM